ncbi:MAG: hypothetical protein HQK76_06840 [Desulfobacterales bacterium]|nr:hypothetical protein [Desulfobacterales bacterium]
MNFSKIYWTYLLLFLLIILPDQSFLEEKLSKKRLAVIGVNNTINNPEWESQLIGYGLSHLLLQQLFNLGNFIPIEDNPIIVEKINKLISLQWNGEKSLYNEKEADTIAKDIGSDVVAYARVIDFKTTQSKTFLGPFSVASTKVEVDIEIFIKEQGHQVIYSKGKGKAETRSKGAFFEIRQDKIYFDKTAVGKAAQKAMENAIEQARFK